jgi:hypothetical protein
LGGRGEDGTAKAAKLAKEERSVNHEVTKSTKRFPTPVALRELRGFVVQIVFSEVVAQPEVAEKRRFLE